MEEAASGNMQINIELQRNTSGFLRGRRQHKGIKEASLESSQDCARSEVSSSRTDLRHFEIEFRYESHGRTYAISGRDNLERLRDLGVSELHSKKHAKFVAMLSSYVQRHYKRRSFGPMILETLTSPLTTHEIATRLGRSDSRAIQELTRLRRKNKVQMFKVRSSYNLDLT